MSAAKGRHRKIKLPKWVKKNPGKGKHGVDDKGATRVGKDWEKHKGATEA